MAKDYFQDIIPPNASAPAAPLRVPEPRSAPPAPPPIPTGERTIRNIQVEKRPVRPVRNRCVSGPTTSAGRRIFRASPATPRAPSRLWIWGAVALSFAVLAAIGLVAFRPTTVTVTPFAARRLRRIGSIYRLSCGDRRFRHTVLYSGDQRP